MQVTELNLYPIKSTQAYQVSQAFIRPQGLHFDREFMLTETTGKFITARKDSSLYRLTAFPIPLGIVICDEKGEQCIALYRDFTHTQTSEVWGTHFLSWVAPKKVNSWLSQYIGREVQLRWIGEQGLRTVETFAKNPLSFADSNPILLTSECSLKQLNKWSPIAVSMAHFRSNIVINGHTPFEEEQWRRIQIGNVILQFAQHCTRCVLVTRNPHTLELDPNVEPFRTLKQHHTNEQGKPIFGIHLVPQNSGVIRCGDTVKVLEKR